MKSVTTAFFISSGILFITSLSLIVSCSGISLIAKGEIQGVYYSTARWIIDGCLTGDCLSYIFVNESKNMAVYARPLLDNVAFVVTSRSIPIDKVQGGNLVANDTWDGFRLWMLDNGFREIVSGTPIFQALLQAFNSLEQVIPVFFLPVFPDVIQEEGWE